MKSKNRVLIASAIFVVFILGGKTASSSTAADRAEGKLQYIEKNGDEAHPNATPTVLTGDEINAYFASGRAKLPAGVRSVIFRGEPGVITASCTVDFDQLTAGARTTNPLLSLFSGVHQIEVIADAKGVHGQGLVVVQSVALDGVIVPRFVLAAFVKSFLQPKYPDVGLESRFQLPDKIDSATVGVNELVVVQR